MDMNASGTILRDATMCTLALASRLPDLGGGIGRAMRLIAESVHEDDKSEQCPCHEKIWFLQHEDLMGSLADDWSASQILSKHQQAKDCRLMG